MSDERLAPGNASPVWMRGWRAGIRACWILLVERSRTGLLDPGEVDLAAEREGLLDPEAYDAETQLLYRRRKETEAELALERARSETLRAEIALLQEQLRQTGRLVSD